MTGIMAGGISSEVGLAVSRSSIIGNTSRVSGGGLYAARFPAPSGVSVRIVNSTIAGNSSTFGGGIQVEFLGVAVESTSIVGNLADVGGGIHNAEGTVEVVNTILALNGSQFGTLNDCEGEITSGDHNLFSTLEQCTLTLEAHDILADPQLAPFQHASQPGRSHAPLLPTSPAIDAGNNAVCPRRDQLGERRVGDCDIGAIEFQGKHHM